MIEEGKGLFESVGCKACHSVDPGQFGTPVGSDENFKPDEVRTTKDFAPNLGKIAEKTNPGWIYAWLKNPRDFSPHTAMPSLRLSDHEAAALTAFLSTLGEKKQDAGVDQALAEADNVKQGEALVRKYGCFGCHEINGMEHESRIGVELSTFGSKHVDELFFGDRTDIPETWDDWTYHKLYTPRVYATADVEQLMPNFDLQEQDINDLIVFLASLSEGKVLERYRSPGSDLQNEIVNGRRMVNFYNCVGCHIVEGRGGYIRRFYQDNPNFAPPILNGEGEKIQPQWLYGFLQGPTPIRPWLKLRMPTFHFAGSEDDTRGQLFHRALRRAGAVHLRQHQRDCGAGAGRRAEADVQGLLQLLQLPSAGRQETRRYARRMGAGSRDGAPASQSRMDTEVATQSAGGPAGHQDAVVLPRRPRRHPGRKRTGADSRHPRLRILVRRSSGTIAGDTGRRGAGQGEQQIGNVLRSLISSVMSCVIANRPGRGMK